MYINQTLRRPFTFIDVTTRVESYTFRALCEGWMLFIAETGTQLPPKLRNLAGRSVDHAPSSLWNCDDMTLRRKVARLTGSILTGVWFSESFADRDLSLEEATRLICRSMRLLARDVGKHLRFVLVIDHSPDGGLHAHVVVEVDWIVQTDGRRVSVFTNLVRHLPDGVVDLSPYVAGGGAFEYQAGHVFGTKSSGSIALVEEHVACGRRGERCKRTRCDHNFWDDDHFANIERYDRSGIPRPARGSVVNGEWMPKVIKVWGARPPASEDAPTTHRVRDRRLAAVRAESAAALGGKRVSARLDSEVAVREARKKMRASGSLSPAPRRASDGRNSAAGVIVRQPALRVPAFGPDALE